MASTLHHIHVLRLQKLHIEKYYFARLKLSRTLLCVTVLPVDWPAPLAVHRRHARRVQHVNLPMQDARRGPHLFATFRSKMVELMREVKARGPVKDDDVSIAAHLLRLVDPATGQPIPDDLLAAEFGVYFAAGIESAGNAMSWTV